MAIAVAYWVLGLGSSFTRYEKLQITNGYATARTGGFTLTIGMTNTGSSAATLSQNNVFFNGKPDAGATVDFGSGATTITLNPGDAATAVISIGSAYKSGTSLEVMIQSAAGNQYPKVIVLP